MPDIFDQVAPDKPAAGGDIFDQVAPDAQKAAPLIPTALERDPAVENANLPDAGPQMKGRALSKARGLMNSEGSIPNQPALFRGNDSDGTPGIRAAEPTWSDKLQRMVFGGPQGETSLGRRFPSMTGARIGDTPATDLPLLNLGELTPPDSNLTHVGQGVQSLAQGGLNAASGLTTPTNLAILAATDGMGAVAPKTGYAAVGAKAAQAALSAYFTYQMGKGALDAGSSAYKKYKAGDTTGAISDLGYASVNAFLAAMGIKHGVDSLAKQHARIGAESAAKFQAKGDTLVPARTMAGGTLAEPTPVRILTPGGPTDAEVQVSTVDQNGRPLYKVVKKDGTIAFGGTGQDVSEWLGQRAVDSKGRLYAKDSTGKPNIATVDTIDQARNPEATQLLRQGRVAEQSTQTATPEAPTQTPSTAAQAALDAPGEGANTTPAEEALAKAVAKKIQSGQADKLKGKALAQFQSDLEVAHGVAKRVAAATPSTADAPAQVQMAEPVQNPVHPLLADLPTPDQAVAQAEQHAQQTVQQLTAIGEAAQQPPPIHPDWDLTGKVEQAKQLAQQSDETGQHVAELGHPDPEVTTLAHTIQQGPDAFGAAVDRFHDYARQNQDGAPVGIFEPPNRQEAFEQAFGQPPQAPKPDIFDQVAETPQKAETSNDQQPSVSVDGGEQAKPETQEQGGGNVPSTEGQQPEGAVTESGAGTAAVKPQDRAVTEPTALEKAQAARREASLNKRVNTKDYGPVSWREYVDRTLHDGGWVEAQKDKSGKTEYRLFGKDSDGFSTQISKFVHDYATERQKLGAPFLKQIPPDVEKAALEDWASGRAYWDNDNNYKLSDGDKIAPWNDAVKSKYSDPKQLTRAARQFRGKQASVAEAKPEAEPKRKSPTLTSDSVRKASEIIGGAADRIAKEFTPFRNAAMNTPAATHVHVDAMKKALRDAEQFKNAVASEKAKKHLAEVMAQARTLINEWEKVSGKSHVPSPSPAASPHIEEPEGDGNVDDEPDHDNEPENDLEDDEESADPEAAAATKWLDASEAAGEELPMDQTGKTHTKPVPVPDNLPSADNGPSIGLLSPDGSPISEGERGIIGAIAKSKNGIALSDIDKADRDDFYKLLRRNFIKRAESKDGFRYQLTDMGKKAVPAKPPAVAPSRPGEFDGAKYLKDYAPGTPGIAVENRAGYRFVVIRDDAGKPQSYISWELGKNGEPLSDELTIYVDPKTPDAALRLLNRARKEGLDLDKIDLSRLDLSEKGAAYANALIKRKKASEARAEKAPAREKPTTPVEAATTPVEAKAAKPNIPQERFDNPRTGKSITISLDRNGKFRLEETGSAYGKLTDARDAARRALELSDGVRGTKLHGETKAAEPETKPAKAETPAEKESRLASKEVMAHVISIESAADDLEKHKTPTDSLANTLRVRLHDRVTAARGWLGPLGKKVQPPVLTRLIEQIARAEAILAKPDVTPAAPVTETKPAKEKRWTPLEIAKVLAKSEEEKAVAPSKNEWLTDRLHDLDAHKDDLPAYMQYMIWGEHGLGTSIAAQGMSKKQFQTFLAATKHAADRESERLGLPLGGSPTYEEERLETGARALARAVYEKLKMGESLGNVTELNKLAEEHFGASRTSGAWTPKDAFDAMEAGINRYLISQGKKLMAMDAIEGLKKLRELMGRITSQGVRTEEQIKKQQFSTPPTESYLAAKVANIKPTDTVMEPSAGNGGLAVWPKAIGAKTMVNEIGDMRKDMLRWLGFEPTSHDGEVINSLLETKEQPTVVIMNPPFSSGALKSHEAKNSNTYGFNHVDSALQRLAPGGRLVAILGGGQANEPNGGAHLGNSKFGFWATRYNIRANVRINGKEYQKYGTNFATRLIVIDKDGPTPRTLDGKDAASPYPTVVKGNVDTLEEAYELLKGVAESRPAALPTRTGSETSAGQSKPGTSVASGQNGGAPSDRPAVPGSRGSAPASELSGGSAQPNGSARSDEPGKGNQQPGVPESAPQPANHPEPSTGSAESSAQNADLQRPLDGTETVDPGLSLDTDKTDHAEQEDSEAYATYRPKLKGPAHPGDIVETKTMATVPMPEITYKPSLPPSVLENGRLSAVQLEAISIAGQQNDIVLPGGFRASALIGDGTGVGKGRISAGILWDNYRKGRKRLIWVSEKWDLMQDATRDLDGIGATDLMRGITNEGGKYVYGSNSAVVPLQDFNATDEIKHDGVLFTTYSLMRSQDKKGNRRIAQIERYLRGDDDGDGAYILYDESHNLKNAVVGQGGVTSQIGVAVKELMDKTPKLRSASLSATAATDVSNLGYLDRLGLWGPGTAFPNGFKQFRSEVAQGGMAAMELIARELKALGKYVSRTLSFKGVTYSEVEHSLNEDQKAIYRTAANAWASIAQEAENTIKETTNGGAFAQGRFLSLFYGAQQRFFNTLITTLKIPTAVEVANQALAEDKSVVITLINTNEAAQNREKNKAKNLADSEDDEQEFDFGPKESLIDLVRNHFPVQQFVDDVDANGKPIKKPLYRTDENGREIPVVNPEAVAKRDALIKEINENLHLPENPLDILIQSLGGGSKVAELTGRKEVFDRSQGKFIPRGDPNVARKDINLQEMRNFQNGKKRVAILSNAAGTGISLHAAKNAKNQQKRVHITLQVGWSADKQMQMFGRTHRTNQAHAPEYKMIVSDLGGEKRFVSTIARRLGSLGALTKGQKNATSGTDLMEKVNFETDQGRQATNSFYRAMLSNVAIPGTKLTGLQVLNDLRMLKPDPQSGALTVPEEDRTNVTRLLNRLLALDPDVQNPVYNYFYDVFQAVVQSAIENGTLDTGVKELHGDEFHVNKPEVLSADPKTGAETTYSKVDASVRTNRMTAKQAEARLRRKSDNATLYIDPNTKSENNLMLASTAPPIVSADGRVTEASYTFRPGDGNAKKAPNYEIERKATPVVEWAKEQADKAKREHNSTVNDLKWRQEDLERSTGRERERMAKLAQEKIQRLESRLTYRLDEADKARTNEEIQKARQELQQANEFQFPDDYYQNRSIASLQEKLVAAKQAMEETAAIAEDPNKWALERWDRLHDAAPTHITEQHHMIGGAVMRFWNPIREATNLGSSIYTATDSKTGRRVVGIDVPAGHIGGLLDRIRSNKSTVNAQQLYTDVLRNGLMYTLEGNIQVKRGTVARTPVIQFIPPNQAIAETLKSLGIKYEKGVMPVYYAPNPNKTGDDLTQTILDKVLKQFPVKPDEAMAEDDAEGEAAEAGLYSRSLRQPKANDSSSNTLDATDSQFVAGRTPGNGTLYVNDPALSHLIAFDSMVRGETAPTGDVSGWTIQSSRAKKIVNELARCTQTPGNQLTKARKTALLRLAIELAQAANDGPIVKIARIESGEPISQVKGTVRHEGIHQAQMSILGNAFSIAGHVDAEKLFNHPALSKTLPFLVSIYGDDKNLLSLEAPAWIGSGEYKRVGLNRAEAVEALAHYFDLLTERYGTGKSLSVLARVNPDLRKELLARHTEQIRSGTATPGAPSRANEGLERRAGSGRLPTSGFPELYQRSGVRSEGENQPGPLGERLPEGRQGGAGSEVQRTTSADEALARRRATQGGFLRVKDPDAAEQNYSGLGALEDVTTRNLSQLRRANTGAWEAGVQAAASKSQASVLIKTAMPAIEKALNGDHSLEEFRTALIESRLRGIQQRWQNLADLSERATPRQLKESAPRLLPLLAHIQDRAGFGRNLQQTAASLLDKEDYPSLKALLKDTFSRAADNVTHILEPAQFDELRYSPSFQDGLRVYKNLLEKPMAESHGSNEGVFSDALGPLDTYYPLVPLRDEKKVRLRTANKQEYSRPRNIMNNFATGLSEDYDTSMEAFRSKMTAAVKANNKAAFLDTLIDRGLVHKLSPHEEVGDRILYRGQEYEAVRMETTPSRIIIQGGKVTHVPPSAVLVPKWLAKELEPVLQNKFQSPTLGVARRIMSLANEYAISGPADFVFHSANLFGAMVANTPFLGNSLLGKAASLPILKRFTAVAKVIATDPTTEEAAADLHEMAKLGMIPDRFGSETYSRKYADMTGAKLRRFSASPLLNGPKGIDVRARLVMYRLAKEINPLASGPQLHMFVNQLGNYTDALQSEVERWAKHIGLSPFATAGTTMLRNGVNAWTGQSPTPEGGAGILAWKLLAGGIGTVALWALAQKAYTGKWPWEDKRSKFLQIPINPVDRHSKLGKELWGKGPETGYVNFTFFNPLVGRGARALGIKGAADEAMEGGTWWQDLEAAQRDMMNSYAHPWLGPIPRAVFVGLTGDEPYLTNLRDDRARFAPQLMPAVRNPGEGNSLLKRGRAAAGELNSFFANVGANSGLGETNKRDTTDHWMRMAADLALPGLVANGQNPAKQAAYVRRQAAAAKRQK